MVDELALKDSIIFALRVQYEVIILNYIIRP